MYSPTDDALIAAAEVYHGQWIARCPRDGCYTIELAGRCDDGSTGGLSEDAFECRKSHGGCGLRCRPVWPDPETRAAIVAALEARPAPMTRNWSPGETIEQLLAENIEHGVRTD